MYSSAFGSPSQSWTMWPRKEKCGVPCRNCCPRDPTTDKRKKMRMMMYSKNSFSIVKICDQRMAMSE